jgi:hypothetical protein
VEWNTPPQVRLVQEQPQPAVQAVEHKPVLEFEQQDWAAVHKLVPALVQRLLAVL